MDEEYQKDEIEKKIIDIQQEEMKIIQRIKNTKLEESTTTDVHEFYNSPKKSNSNSNALLNSGNNGYHSGSKK